MDQKVNRMDTNIFRGYLKKTVQQRNIFLVFTIALLAVLTLENALLFNRKERIVIVPMQGHEYWLEKDYVSDNYIEGMGVFLSGLFLNKTSSDCEWKHRQILKHVHPSAHYALKHQFEKEATDLKNNNQSYVFHPEKSYLDQTNKSFVLEGELVVFVGRKGEHQSCVSRNLRRYIFDFECQNGKLLLRSLQKEGIST